MATVGEGPPPERRARSDGELWTSLKAPQLPVPPHVVRAKSRLMQALVTELAAVVAAVARYRQAIDDFFATMPAAAWGPDAAGR